jgi:hypothetical protein
MDPDKQVFNTSENLLVDKEVKFHSQAISKPNANLWQPTIKPKLDAIWHNHT